MPRPLWTGYISFGLVTIPCTLSSLLAREDEIDFDMLDKRDLSRVRYQRVSEKTGREVPWKEIVKGTKVSSGKYVVLEPDDFKNAAPKQTKMIDITDFVKQDEIPVWYYEKPYAVMPREGGEKGFALLRAGLEDVERVGIASVVLHTRQRLAALLPHGKGLVLNTLRFDSELRDPREFEAKAAVGARGGAREVQMATTLIEGMSSSWTPEVYHDEYREKLKKWIEQRAKKGAKALPEPEEEPEETGPYNIMDLLKKSIEAKKGGARRSSPKTLHRRKAG